MEALLFLAHRIPFPPNKGDKIRSFNLLKLLSRHFRISLGAFVDDDEDWQYQSELADFVDDMCLVPLNPRLGKAKSLRALVTGGPLGNAYYASQRMQSWVNGAVVRKSITRTLVFSSTMAQFVSGPRFDHMHRVMDMVDVDSEKWRAYARKHTFPMSWIYAREANELLAFERRVAADFERTVFVSEAEAQVFRTLAPETGSRVSPLPNGVDIPYFTADAGLECPYAPDETAIVFTGAMDYWANVDAVTWFASEVFPLVQQEMPDVQFYIVGSRPTEAVRNLARKRGVVVTGGVRDIRPYIQYARAAVAPLRIARGIQNKVLEAMSMERPVVATPQAMEGIRVGENYSPLIAAEPADFARSVIWAVTNERAARLAEHGRDYVLQHHDWQAVAEPLLALFDVEPAVAAENLLRSAASGADNAAQSKQVCA